MAANWARLIVLDKPAGSSSFDMVRQARRITRQRRVGHGGTLDPFATGVLILAVGAATRLLTFVTHCTKRYTLTVRFGQATDTHDGTGRVTEVGEVSFGEDRLRQALTEFVGEISQQPPAVSALKVNGQRAYRLARQGRLVEDLPARTVHIASIELLEARGQDVVLRVDCGGGTYMRALARDLGRRLGCPAHAARLRREAVGAFEIGEAVTLEGLPAAWPAGPGVLDPVEVARGWPRHRLNPGELARVRHGAAIVASTQTPPDQPVGLLDEQGRLVAVAHGSEGLWQPTVVLPEAEHGAD